MKDAKQRVLSLYPDAKCLRRDEMWLVVTESGALSHSYQSEDMAWEWAISVANRKILRKFEE